MRRARYASVCETRLVSASGPGCWLSLCAEKCRARASQPFLPTLHVNTSLNGLQVDPGDKTDIQSTALLKTLEWPRCICSADPQARL
jgi:hypothetical protein